jgi:hypothetical protein
MPRSRHGHCLISHRDEFYPALSPLQGPSVCFPGKHKHGGQISDRAYARMVRERWQGLREAKRVMHCTSTEITVGRCSAFSASGTSRWFGFLINPLFRLERKFILQKILLCCHRCFNLLGYQSWRSPQTILACLSRCSLKRHRITRGDRTLLIVLENWTSYLPK